MTQDTYYRGMALSEQVDPDVNASIEVFEAEDAA